MAQTPKLQTPIPIVEEKVEYMYPTPQKIRPRLENGKLIIKWGYYLSRRNNNTVYTLVFPHGNRILLINGYRHHGRGLYYKSYWLVERDGNKIRLYKLRIKRGMKETVMDMRGEELVKQVNKYFILKLVEEDTIEEN